jgi:hypothetical protein
VNVVRAITAIPLLEEEQVEVVTPAFLVKVHIFLQQNDIL